MEITASSGVLVLVGDLDVRSVSAVREALVQLMETTPGDVVIDVAGVELIDVTGLGMLAAAHRRAQREDRQLLLRGCQGPVRRVLGLTRLGRVLHQDAESLTA